MLKKFGKEKKILFLKIGQNIAVKRNIRKVLMSKIKKYIFILLTLIINLIMIFFFIYRNFYNLKTSIYHIFFNKLFLIIFFIIFFHYILNALILKIFMNLYTNYPFYKGLITFLISSFYSKIIPGANAGKIMQIYVLKKQGVQMNIAVSLTIMEFILRKIITFLIIFLSIIFRFNFFQKIGFDKFAYLTIIFGFFINFFLIFFIFLMIFSFKIKKNIVNLITLILNKFRSKKNDDTKKTLFILIENFKVELQRLLSNYKITFLISFIVFLDLFFYFLIPWFIGIVFGFNNINNSFGFFDICILSSFHCVAIEIVPFIPGFSELLFLSLFNKFYKTDMLTNLSQFIWRFFTFYFDLIIGGFIKIFYKVQTKNDEIIEISRKTFVAIQLETFEERKKTSDNLFKTKFLGDNLQNKLKNFFVKEKKENKDYGLNDVDLEENNDFKNLEKNDKKKKKKWCNFDI